MDKKETKLKDSILKALEERFNLTRRDIEELNNIVFEQQEKISVLESTLFPPLPPQNQEYPPKCATQICLECEHLPQCPTIFNSKFVDAVKNDKHCKESVPNRKSHEGIDEDFIHIDQDLIDLMDCVTHFNLADDPRTRLRVLSERTAKLQYKTANLKNKVKSTLSYTCSTGGRESLLIVTQRYLKSLEQKLKSKEVSLEVCDRALAAKDKEIKELHSIIAIESQTDNEWLKLRDKEIAELKICCTVNGIQKMKDLLTEARVKIKRQKASLRGLNVCLEGKNKEIRELKIKLNVPSEEIYDTIRGIYDRLSEIEGNIN